MTINAAPSEIIQTIAAGCGLIYTVRGLSLAHNRIVWLERQKINGPRLFWTRSRETQKWYLFAAQAVLLGVGAAGCVLAPPAPFLPLMTQSNIRIWGETLVSLALALKSYRDDHDQRAIDDDKRWDGVNRRVRVS
jgi:hypothetical protein